jgi:hypothetical protein
MLATLMHQKLVKKKPLSVKEAYGCDRLAHGEWMFIWGTPCSMGIITLHKMHP